MERAVQFLLFRLGSSEPVEITRDEFDCIRTAKDSYGSIIGVENNFDAALEDYVELEETLFHFGARYLVFRSADHFDFDHARNTISRRLLHFLSMAKLYRNSLLRQAAKLFGKGNEFIALKIKLADSPNLPIE